MLNQQKWDLRYLTLAKLVASWSKDPSTKCGAVIVNPNNEIVSIGFNGFPKSVIDSEERLNNRQTKLQMMVHAERNALIFAKQDLHKCTIYTYPMMACSECAAMIIQAGISRHVSMITTNKNWKESFVLASQMFDEAGVNVDMYLQNELENV
jgi:dCMP deaminase